jgi:recombinational DNA repair protein RecT
MTDIAKQNPRETFELRVGTYARSMIADIVDAEIASKAAARVTLAFRMAARTAPDLYGCEPGSVAAAVALVAMTGLSAGGVNPEVYLIPRRNKGKMELQAQVSARGMQALAQRAGWIVTAEAVHVDDHYLVTRGTDARIEHEPSGKWPQSWADIQGVYVTGRHLAHGVVCVDVPLGAIDVRRKMAQSDRFWSKWPVEMACKTAVMWAIARGHFGSMNASPELAAVGALEARHHREETPARTYQRPQEHARIEVDAAAFEAAFAEPEEAE